MHKSDTAVTDIVVRNYDTSWGGIWRYYSGYVRDGAYASYRYFRERQWVSTTLFVLNVSYANLSSTSLNVYNCLGFTVHGITYHARDLSVECYTVSHRSLMILAGVMTAFVIAGFPSLFAYVLYRNRHKLRKPSVFMKYGFLYGGFRDDRYWYESTVLVRKALLVLIAAVVKDWFTQIVLSLILFLFAVILQAILRPYKRAAWNWLELLCQTGTMLTQLLTMLYFRINVLAGQCSTALSQDSAPDPNSGTICRDIPRIRRDSDRAITVVLALLNAFVLGVLMSSVIRAAVQRLLQKIRGKADPSSAAETLGIEPSSAFSSSSTNLGLRQVRRTSTSLSNIVQANTIANKPAITRTVSQGTYLEGTHIQTLRDNFAPRPVEQPSTRAVRNLSATRLPAPLDVQPDIDGVPPIHILNPAMRRQSSLAILRSHSHLNVARAGEHLSVPGRLGTPVPTVLYSPTASAATTPTLEPVNGGPPRHQPTNALNTSPRFIPTRPRASIKAIHVSDAKPVDPQQAGLTRPPLPFLPIRARASVSAVHMRALIDTPRLAEEKDGPTIGLTHGHTVL